MIVQSFDFYDTIAIRALIFPQDVNVLIAHDQRVYAIDKQFTEHRCEAESLAHKISPTREATLDNIYESYHNITGLSRDAIDTLKAVELEIESKLLFPYPTIIERISKARADGKMPALVSDMWHPKSFFQSFLKAHNIPIDDDQLRISSLEHASKRHGNLYTLLKQDWPQWELHIGDNKHVDVKIAQKYGVQADWVPETHPNPREIELRACTQHHSLLVAGLSKVTRLSKPKAAPDSWTIGANLTGPIFYSFVYWTLIQACRDKIDTLFFPSREGQILHAIATKIKSHLAHTSSDRLPKLRYLYCSRQSIRFALLDLDNDEHFNWILDAQKHNFISYLENLHVTEEEILPHIKEAPTTIEELRAIKPITQARVCIFKNIIQTKAIRELIEQKLKNYRKSLLKYFEDNGISTIENLGFIDVGWNTTIQDAIEALTEMQNGRRVRLTGFYLGSQSIRPNISKAYNFIATPEDFPKWLDKGRIVVESLLPANHGQVLGYQESNNSVSPTTSPYTHLPQNESDAVCNAAVFFTKQALKFNLKEYPIDIHLRNFLASPTKQEARLLQDLKWSSGRHQGLPLIPKSPFSNLPWPEGYTKLRFYFLPNFLLKTVSFFLYNLEKSARKYLEKKRGISFRKP